MVAWLDDIEQLQAALASLRQDVTPANGSHVTQQAQRLAELPHATLAGCAVHLGVDARLLRAGEERELARSRSRHDQARPGVRGVDLPLDPATGLQLVHQGGDGLCDQRPPREVGETDTVGVGRARIRSCADVMSV